MSTISAAFKEKISELKAFAGTPGANDKYLIYNAANGELETIAGTAFPVVDENGDLTIEGSVIAGTGFEIPGFPLSNLLWLTVNPKASALDIGSGTGKVVVVAGGTGISYRVREIIMIGGGTNFGAGGDRNLSLTDGTNVWTTIANADLEALPTDSLRWGDVKVPLLGSSSNAISAADQDIYFQYSGGSTEHTTGSVNFSILIERLS